MGYMPGGGDAIGLSGVKLAIGIVGNAILGALMTAGVGLFAPCMALDLLFRFITTSYVSNNDGFLCNVTANSIS